MKTGYAMLMMGMMGALQSGCLIYWGPGDDVACTEEARSSVVVTVTDSAGRTLTGAEVTYSVDGGPFMTADCVEGSGESCTTWVAGWEVAGEFVVRAGKDGYVSEEKSLEVGMTDDGCHVQGRSVTLALEAETVECDAADAAPSVIVEVVDGTGQPLAGATAMFSYAGGEYQAGSCWDVADAADCTTFAYFGGIGGYDVRVEKDGYQTFATYVEVAATDDPCAVDTQEIVATLRPEDVVCTEEEVPSAIVQVVDEQGNALPGATVSWSVGGGAFSAAICADGGDADSCASFVAGYEVAGELVILAEKSGYRAMATTVSVGMTEDGCHVATRDVTMTLIQDVVACTDQVVPSVVVEVVDAAGAPLGGAEVTWSVDGSAFAGAECATGDGDACSTFYAGYEQTGVFVVRADKGGYESTVAAVTVELDADGCHVVTESATLPLLAEADADL